MKNSKRTILGISASPRARLSTGGYLETLDRITDYQKMYEVIYEFAGEKKISNTEGLLLAALFGARSEEVEIDVVNLRDVFESGRMSRKEFAEKVDRCSGVIVGTPVYFGDRSSWFDKMVNLLKADKVETGNKVFGAISVGAKRNGGQETTLIFGLLDALNMGFNVVGNGPPTSQFGGTGWAGDVGKIQDDNFGLDTSMGLGKRVNRYVDIISSGEAPYGELTIGIIHSGFRGNDGEIKDMVSRIESAGAGTRLLDIDDLKIKPCLGCPVCPSAPGTEYGCVIRDEMEKMRKLSSSVDGLVFMLCRGRKDEDQYQMFLERTRFIRRDNFIMSDLPFGAYCVEDGCMGNQYATRMFMSFLRHNMFITSPLVQLFNGGEHTVCTSDPSELCSRLLHIASRSKTARAGTDAQYEYKAVGYGKNK